MERVLERFRRRLCLRVFRAEHALLSKKNASTMNIAHVSMAQIAAPINVRARKPASINNQTEIVNGERGHYLVWSVRVKG